MFAHDPLSSSGNAKITYTHPSQNFVLSKMCTRMYTYVGARIHTMHTHTHMHTRKHTYTDTHTVTLKCTYINLYLSLVAMFHVDYSVTTTLLHEYVALVALNPGESILPSPQRMNLISGISHPNVLLVYGWGSI